jgi:hypothetical protein
VSFPAQGEQGQEVAVDQGPGVFVGVDLLAFIDDHKSKFFAVEGENAPGAVGLFEDADHTPLFFFSAAKAFKPLHGLG